MTRENIGVLVARFQVPTLTKGHLSALRQVQEKSDKMVVVLGCAAFPSPRNPLNFEMRRDMLFEAPAEARPFFVLPLPDVPEDNKQWSRNLDTLLRLVFPYADITLYGGRDSFLPCYKGSFKTQRLLHHEEYAGTQAREDVTNGRPQNSQWFRAGVIWAVTNYRVLHGTESDSPERQLQGQPLAPVSTWDDRRI